jgi:hypothetical protein
MFAKKTTPEMKWFFVVIESRGIEFRENEKGSPKIIILRLPPY